MFRSVPVIASKIVGGENIHAEFLSDTDGYESSRASQCEQNGFRRFRGLPLHLSQDTADGAPDPTS